MNLHTPGPWEFYEDEEGETIVIEKNGEAIGTVKNHYDFHKRDPVYLRRDHEEAVANARLIAMAPTLLARTERLAEILRRAVRTASASEEPGVYLLSLEMQDYFDALNILGENPSPQAQREEGEESDEPFG